MISSKNITFRLFLSTAVVATLQALASAQVVNPFPVLSNTIGADGGADVPPPFGDTLTIGLPDSQDRTIILWDSFDIGSGNVVDFEGIYTCPCGPTPPPLAVLNRVMGTDASEILGALNSEPNIQVLLINQNGILFGSTAQVDVGSLIASTLDIDDDDFLAGGILDSQNPSDPTHYYVFQDNVDTGVTVEGGAQVETSTGSLSLLGAYVHVEAGGSVISATDVGLIAGTEIRVPANPGSPLSFQIRQPTPVEDAIIIGGTVSGRNIYAYMNVDEDAQNALLLVTDTGSLTATTDGGGDIILAIAAQTSEGDVTNSPGGIRNNGALTAAGDMLLVGGTTASGESAPPQFVENNGTIFADGDAELTALGIVTNSGVISVDGVANLESGDDIDNSGSIAAVRDAILTAVGDILDSSGSLAGSISGADVALSAGGLITAGTVTARDDIAIRAPGTVMTRSLTSGATIGSNGPVEVAGAADDLLEGTNLTGHDVDVDGIVIYAGIIRAIGTNSDIRLGAPVSLSLSDLDFAAGGDITIDGPASGVDVAMDAGGTITAGDISARDDIGLRAGTTLDVGLLQSGVPIGNLGPVDQAGSADALLGATLTGHDLFVQAAELSRDQATANGTNSDLIMRATIGDLSIDNGLAGGNVDLGAAQLVTVGTVVAQAGDVIILADDLDILGSISGSQVSITNRSGGNAVTVVGDASAAGAFTLTEFEINRINADVLNINSLDQNLLVGNIAFDNDVGSTRIGLLGTGRIDMIGEVDASGVTRTLQVGGTTGAADPNDPSTLASIIRIAPMSSGGGRIILGGGSLDLRGVKIGVGLDDGFLQQLGLIAGGTPASTEVVQEDWVGNLNSTLYGILGGYADPIVISAGSITVTYTDYALFQNTGSPSSPSGVNADNLSIISSGNDGNSFELFGTIDEVGGRGAALLVEPTAVSLATSRVNGCLIVTGGGCGGGGPTDNSRDPADFNPTAAPEPPNGEFSSSALGGAGGEFAEQELVSTDDDQAFEFDSLVGTNNEGLLGVLGVDDADAPEQCAPDDKRPLCRNEEKPDAQ